MNTNIFTGKKVLVCGMARSGQSAVRLLRRLGADVTAQDLKETGQIDWTFSPEEENVRLYLGKNPDAVVELFDYIIISPGIPVSLPFIKKARALNIPVWGELELAFRQCPCPVIAVTGTNGKTTTTMLTGEILKKIKPHTIIAGNIGYAFTDFVRDLNEDALAVVEVSSFQLETAHTFAPLYSAVLNITPDHLDRHGSLENYQAIKEKVFANQRAGAAVLNYDDPRCRAMTPPCDTVFFSIQETLEQGVFLDGGKIRARFNSMDETITDISKTRILPENALAAAALSLLAGTPPETVAEVLENFPSVEHRIEYLGTFHGVEYYNDSKATNVESAVKGLEAMRKPVILIGGGYDKQSSFENWVRVFDGKVKHLIVMGATAEKIIETCRAFSFEAYERVNSLRDAVTLAAAQAAPGDCVLLSPACASWDMFDNFEQRGQLFKQFVREGEGNHGQ